MRILFCAQDPGGANAVSPLIAKIQNSSPRASEKNSLFCTVWGAKHAVKIFHRKKISRVKDCTILRYEKLKKLFLQANPRAVCTGTSEGYGLEKKVTKIARGCGIPTISIIDSWMNYAERYSGSKNKRDLLYLTDIICVNDKLMQEGCAKEGIPKERVKITGNPHLAESVKKIKPRTGKIAKLNLLFVSQPLNRQGVTQYSVTKDLFNFPAIKKFANIIIRPHPREKEDALCIKIMARRKGVAARIERDADIYTLINNASLIIGINSIILFESAMGGKTVISYQPHIAHQKQDTLINNQLGISYKAYSKKHLYALLSKYLKGKLPPLDKVAAYRRSLIQTDAGKNVLEILKKI